MVKYGKLPRAEPPPLPAANPYDLVTVYVGNLAAQARPYDFDSEAVDQNAYNAHGQPIRPIKAIASCPNCGAGIDIDLRLGVVVNCDGCGLGTAPVVAPLADPFCNPVADGRIAAADLVDAASDLGAAVTVAEVSLEGDFNLPLPPAPATKKKPTTGGKGAELGSVVDLGPEPD